MTITNYVVLILSSFVFEAIDWLVEVVGVTVGSLVTSINDVVWMIDGFVTETEVESVGKVIGGLEGADAAAPFIAAEGTVPVVGSTVGCIVNRLLQVLNVVEIDTGFSVIIL